MTIETQGEHWNAAAESRVLPTGLASSVRKGAGTALLGGVALSVLALASWNVADPSFSVATDAEATNWLGAPGAMLSDLMMQVAGLGSLACLAVPVAWGFALRRGEGPGPLLAWPSRVGWWFGGTFAAAAGLGALPPTEAWPLLTGFGGIMGDLVLRPIEVMMGASPEGLGAVALAVPFAVLARIALKRAASLKLASDSDEKGRLGTAVAVAVGTAAHWWYSARGIAARVRTIAKEARDKKREAMLARGHGGQVPVPSAVSFDRNPFSATPQATPHMAGGGQSVADPLDGTNTLTAPVVAAPAPIPIEAVAMHAPDYRESAVPPRENWDTTPIVAMGPDGQPAAHAQSHWDEEKMRVHGLLPPRRPAREGERVDPSFDAEPILAPQPFAVSFAAPTYGAQPGFTVTADIPGAVPVPTASATSQMTVDAPPVDAQGLRPTVRVQAPGQRVATPPQQIPARQGLVHAMPQAASAAAPTTQSSFAPAAAAGQGATTIREAPQGAPERFELPSLDYLREKGAAVQDPSLSPEALRDNAAQLEAVLADFGVKGSIIDVKPGPVVTLYELEPAPGIKSSRVIGLAEDIARSMSAIAARVAVVPGRNAIGIELPNSTREMVMLREIFERPEFADSKQRLALSLGKTIGGEPVVADLAKMPHLLVAGTTGSGKSVAINTMILSLLFRMTPAQCRLIMIDPKMLELSVYDGIPHLLSPVVTDPKKAVVALKWCVREMEERYKKMAKLGVRNVEGFNSRVREAEGKGEALSRTVQTGFDRATGEAIYETEELDLAPMPFIVVIIDEMADLMMVAGKDIEGAVQRLAQMARAAGIHVVMATQRPSVDVITGTIKANFPTRISFQVTSKIDSRTILGEQGAEQLLGMGDMLYMASGGRTQRVHGPFVSDEEVEEIVSYLKTQGVPDYLDDVLTDEDEEAEDDTPVADNGAATMAESEDPYDQAVALVLRDGKASTSYVQRRLGIGYNRAASIIERMEQEGVIGPANHAGKREILLETEPEAM